MGKVFNLSIAIVAAGLLLAGCNFALGAKTEEVESGSSQSEIKDSIDFESKELTNQDFNLGKMTIGMTKQQVIDVMGQPDRKEVHPNGSDERYYYQDQVQVMLMDEYVYFIEVLSPEYMTIRGLKVGDSKQKLVEIYGDAFIINEDPYTGSKTYSFAYKDEAYVFHVELLNDVIIRLQVNEIY